MVSVAIVDDDAIQQFMFRKSIDAINITGHTYSFDNGRQILDYLMVNKSSTSLLPDIIFLDINMPVMDGFQFLNNFGIIKCELAKHIRIYILSSSILDEEIILAKKNPDVYEFLSKPLKLAKLNDIINEFRDQSFLNSCQTS